MSTVTQKSMESSQNYVHQKKSFTEEL